jgi:hypothetical protein
VATTDRLEDQSIEVIEEYLAVAKLCVQTKKSNGGIWG